METQEKEEAIVLNSLEFKERSRIITLFTKTSGVISLIVKTISSKKRPLFNLTTPLCRGEFLYRLGKNTLHKFLDGTIIDMHLPLRKSYDHLEAAGYLIQAIKKSQLPEKPAPKLYNLCSSYLKHLPEFKEPKILAASFYLKILKHEGLIALAPKGQSCNKENFSNFTPPEWNELLVLSEARTFADLQTVDLSSPLFTKIEQLFESKNNSII